MRWGRIACGALLLAVVACSAPPDPVTAVVRNPQEARVGPDGLPVPVLIGAEAPLELCMEAPPGADVRHWRLSVTVGGRRSPSGAVAPGARLGPTVCFQATLPKGLAEDVNLPVDAELSRGEGARAPVASGPVRWRRGDPARAELEAALDAALRDRFEAQEDVFIAHLDEIAAAARSHELPLLETRVRLVAVHFLSRRLSADAFAAAERRLARLPPWLSDWSGSRLAASLAYQRALLGLNAGADPEGVWKDLAAAERGYVRVAEERFLLPIIVQSGLLAEAGAVKPAIHRLRAGLDDCRDLGCADWILTEARDQLAWVVLLDPLASDDDLREAGEILARARDDEDPALLANRLLNRAFLAVRTDHDPEPYLRPASDRLRSLGDDRERARLLLDFAELVRGLAALSEQDGARALEHCQAVAGRPDSWTAWALGCAARAHRLLGDRDAAQRMFDQALHRHEHGDPRAAGIGIPLGVAQRALDYASAALIAVERGAPETAWRLLTRLDAVSMQEGERRRCRADADGTAVAAEWRRLDDEARELLGQLTALSAPVATVRVDEVDAARRRAMRRLQDLWWEWPGCYARSPTTDTGLEYRAFAAEDTVVLLRRTASGAVEVARRTDRARRRLARDLAAIDVALARRELDDRSWRRLLAPLAEAVLPGDLDRLEAVTSYALHGELQGVPLAALPVTSATGSARWLGEATTVVVQPAMLAGPVRSETASDAPGPPVFVVDPRGDLAGSTRRAALYRRQFPGARVLLRGSATRDALVRGVRGGQWLHFDGHGLYEPAFPELSSLVLSDGRVRWLELAARGGTSLGFANLSGCRTGSWPTTAGSGHYGFCGLLARSGTPWVVCTRADLDDTVAGEFNAAFYREIRAEATVPGAYRQALTAVSGRHPAAAWAALVLLRGPVAAADGHDPRGRPRVAEWKGGSP